MQIFKLKRIKEIKNCEADTFYASLNLYHLCLNIIMDFFVNKNSIVRKIWGKSDTVLFIFAGSAAEFALNKAVDWLYFTGNLPANPVERLFSTVAYAKKIIFAERICGVLTPALISPPGMITSLFHFTAVVVTGEL